MRHFDIPVNQNKAVFFEYGKSLQNLDISRSPAINSQIGNSYL